VADRDAEVSKIRAQLEAANAAAAEPTGNADADELRRRVAELEDARRTDIAEVQHAHEQLANTQLELKQARHRIEAMRDQLASASVATGASTAEAPDAVPSYAAFDEPAVAEGSPVFEPPDEATVGSRLSAFRKRRSAPRIPDPDDRWEPVAETPAEPEPQDPPAQEISPEGLSLRERLTRAAAARHRVTTPTERDER
jgi:hypothetical protein